MRKFFLAGFVFIFVLLGFVFAEQTQNTEFVQNLVNIENQDSQNYILFYANSCPHCQSVENFFVEYGLVEKYDIRMVEVREDRENLDIFREYLLKLGLTEDHLSVPFLVMDDAEFCNYVHGSVNIKNYFEVMLGLAESQWEDLTCSADQEVCEQLTCEEHSLVADFEEKDELGKRLSFFGIMLPAALADSINPCAFAVILLLLSAILSKEDSRKKAIYAGLLFSLAVFLSYLVMWLWLFSALANANNTFVLKIVVWWLWIVVWLANLKDFFRYGKWFVMEVPLAWRPKMKKIIEKVVSPTGAFFIGLVVSLFLLPCTSGPYFTILGYLASENSALNTWGIIYLLVYNLIFILPMLFIVLIVGKWRKSADEIAKLKNKNKKIIHLVVWLLMLGLGLYVFGDVFMRWI